MNSLLDKYIECDYSISTDTRKIKQGSLFIALTGENFNGNKFAGEALSKGAKYVIIDQREFALDERFIVVENSLDALQSLANEYRKTLKCPVLGITGSNGKTTAKELINSVLAKKYKVHATPGNFNNHIGLPLTVLSANKNTEFLILEMGDNHSGEIKLLSEIGEPDYGLVTNVGKDHIEGFGSFEANKHAKKELYDYLALTRGTAFIPAFEDDLEEMSNDIKTRVLFGNHDHGLDIKLTQADPILHFNIDDRNSIKTNLIGEYNIKNIQMAVNIGHYFGVELKDIENAIAEYIPSNNRSQFIEKNGHKIFLDAYNANPSSMKLALESFFKQNLLDNKLVVLGDMLELGQESLKEHQLIVDYLSRKNADIRLVGSEFSSTKTSSNMKVYQSRHELIEELRQYTIPNSQILLKGSRGIRLEETLEVL